MSSVQSKRNTGIESLASYKRNREQKKEQRREKRVNYKGVDDTSKWGKYEVRQKKTNKSFAHRGEKALGHREGKSPNY